MSLAKSIPTILAGSVVAGFGLSLGRDLYRWIKRYIGMVAIVVIPILLLLAPLLGVFIAFRAFAINDPNLRAAVKRKAIAGGILGATLLVGAVPLMLLATIIPSPFRTAADPLPNGVAYWLEVWTTYPTRLLTGERRTYGEAITVGFDVAWKWVLVLIAAFAGVLTGVLQRHRRRRMFSAISHNEQFLIRSGLTQTGPDILIDKLGNGYRLHDRTDAELIFFVSGRRHKRARLTFDQHGRFTNWSGILAG